MNEIKVSLRHHTIILSHQIEWDIGTIHTTTEEEEVKQKRVDNMKLKIAWSDSDSESSCEEFELV